MFLCQSLAILHIACSFLFFLVAVFMQEVFVLSTNLHDREICAIMAASGRSTEYTVSVEIESGSNSDTRQRL
jgi:hypothetical protein